MSSAPRYWHGGSRGLHPGDLVLPASESGFEHPTWRYMTDEERERLGDLDVVYVTTERDLARFYAAQWCAPGVAGGTLYEVEPEGDLEPDPDVRTPDVSFRCSRARVLTVYDTRVQLDGRLIRKAERLHGARTGVFAAGIESALRDQARRRMAQQ